MSEWPDTPREGFAETVSSVQFIIKDSQALLVPAGTALMVILLLLPCHWVLRGLWESHQQFPGGSRSGFSLVPRISALQGMLGGSVAAGTVQVSKLCLFSFLILSSHNFMSSCCTPAQSKEGSTFWFVIKVILKISWRDPLGFSSYHIKSRDHVCLFVLFPAVNFFLSPSAHFYRNTLRVKEMIKGLEQLVWERTFKYA